MARNERMNTDDGAVLPILAISVLALLAVTALVIDGAAMYSQRRSMQNASDAAALAGTIALDDVRFSGVAHSTVAAEVERVATANGADRFDCSLLNASGQPITRVGSPVPVPCEQATEDEVKAATQVRVEAVSDRETSFGKLVGIETTTAPADATAALQRLVGYAGAQFAVCSSGASYNILRDDNTVDPDAARGYGLMVLKGAQLYNPPDSTCGRSSNFKGEIDQEPLVIGEEIVLGVANGSTKPDNWEANLIRCPGDESGEECLLLPVIRETWAVGQNMRMTPVAWGYWRATESCSGFDSPAGLNGVVRLCGEFVEAATPGPLPPEVVFGDGDVKDGDIRRARLVE